MKAKGVGRALTTLGLLALPEPKVFLQRQVAQAQHAAKRAALGMASLAAAGFLFFFALIWMTIGGYTALQQNLTRPQAAMGVAVVLILFGVGAILLKKFAFTKKRAWGT